MLDVRIRARDGGAWAMLLVCVAMLAFVVWTETVRPGQGLVAWAPLPAVLALVLVARLYVTGWGWKVVLAMDATGLRHAWFGRIPWEEVHGIALVSTQTRYGVAHALVLGVDDPERFDREVPALARMLRYAWPAAVRSHPDVIHLPLDRLDREPRQVEAAAIALRDRVPPARIPGWSADMSRNDREVAEELRRIDAEASTLSPEEVRRRLQALAPKVEAGLREADRLGRRAWILIVGAGLVILGVCVYLAWHAF